MSNNRLTTRTLAVRGGLAVALSLFLNYLLLTIILQLELVATYDHLAYPPVTLWTTIGVVGATVAYGVVTRRSNKPERTFVRLVVVVLLLSFIPDVALLVFDNDATVGAVTALAILHIPPAAVCIGVLTGRFTIR